MEANEFIAKLKADGSAKDQNNLTKVWEEYKVISSKLPAKDRGQFSLNVLCILCRNLDKVPTWRDSVDNKALLTLSIECVRETRALERADRVKTLACVYHIHRHVSRQNKPLPPELVLKISFMPFEVDSPHLLKEYCKTYWNLLADRLNYIERLKTKVAIIKLLPKITEDILKIIDIYDTEQFCANILVFLVKKLHFLYNESNAKELNQIFGQIFSKLSAKNDLKEFKKLTEKENFDIYVKLNDCLYVIAENGAKTHFRDCPLDMIVRACISLLGHRQDLFHCLQTFYLNSFCSILSAKSDISYKETVLNSMLISFESTEKLGYGKAMVATYPFLSQFLRLYVEYNVTNSTTKLWKDHFSAEIQENCLKLMLFFMKKLENCDQLLKCENCRVRTGLHDSLRLSFLVKHFANISISQNIVIIDILPTFFNIITKQYTILTNLNSLGCVNYQKCFRKLQTDIHNTAIALNKAQYYEYSIKLFEIYLRYELKSTPIEHKNVSRALYNKSICELDSKLYEIALIDAFLSLIFSGQDGLNSDKYMSLVMDIKAKELKSKSPDDEEEPEADRLQLLTVLDACKMAMEDRIYGDLTPFVAELKFSILLKHEFAMYSKLWPSIAPTAGVWRALLGLARGEHDGWLISVENESAIVRTLYEVVLATPSVVRTVHSDHYVPVVDELLDKFHEDSAKISPEERLVHAALLFLRSEYDIAAASRKYGWKGTEPLQSTDPDQVPANRTVPQEHAAAARAVLAVQLLAPLVANIGKVSGSPYIRAALQIYQVFVPQLLHLSRDVQALQLAYTCCVLADCVGDDETYVRNAGTLLYHSAAPSPRLREVVAAAGARWAALAEGGAETAIIFLCDCAIYYCRCGSGGAAARLLRLAQARTLAAYDGHADVSLDLAVGRLLEAQTLLCAGAAPSALSAVNGTQRHYLSMCSTGTKWTTRRLASLTLRYHTSVSSLRATALPRALRQWRRARGAAAAALAHASAVTRAELYADITDVCSFDDAQIKIDNRLKHILGLQPSNETQPYYATTSPTAKPPQFTPKQELETMRDNMFRKNQTSPSLPCISVPGFKTPDFVTHSSKCTCYACDVPICHIIALKTCGLEASMYFRANENEIARNYFDGVMNLSQMIDTKLKDVLKYKDSFEGFVVDTVAKFYESHFKKAQLEILIELSFFELKNKNYDLTDEYVVRIHEIIQELGGADQYLSTEVMNLMTASAQMRNIIRKRDETGLEDQFESLKLSPVKDIEPPSTPISKPTKLPKPATKLLVKDEELPKKRKVIKLNLDDVSAEEDFEKPTRSLAKSTKKAEFKVPNPITAKPVLEIATPRPTRAKPLLIVTQPSEERPSRSTSKMLVPRPSEDFATPKTQLDKTKNEYFTPSQSTPEQFFTPMTSIKTYSKKSLRHNIVKNLEQEFSTPKATINKHSVLPKSSEDKENTVLPGQSSVDKENTVLPKNLLNVPKKSTVKSETGSKKILKRATSPGKLCKEKKDMTTRARRLRQHVNYSVDEDDRK